MFEIHGWATIHFTAENRDLPDEDELQAAAVEQVHRHVQQLGYDPVGKQIPDRRVWDTPPHSRYSGQIVSAAKANVVLGFGFLNGGAHLWAAGSKNHATPLAPGKLGLFADIAR